MVKRKQEKTVIFTGAGASRALGYPTTAEFFDPSKSGHPWSPSHGKLFEDLKKWLGVQVVDVEDALRILKPIDVFLSSPSGKFLCRYLKGHDRVQGASPFQTLARQIKDRCFTVYARRPSLDEVSSIYQPLLYVAGWNNITVDFFTTNYDLTTDRVLEMAHTLGLNFSDGFDQFGQFDQKMFEQAGDDGGVKIYRLHGSMSWVYDGGEILKSPTISKQSNPHVFIAPGYKGDPEDDPNEYDIVRFIHKEFRKSLGEAGFCITVGFSFRDPHINSIFRQCLKLNPGLHVINLLPSIPKTTDSEFESLLQEFPERFFHVHGHFGDEEDLAEVQSVLETLRLEKREKGQF